MASDSSKELFLQQINDICEDVSVVQHEAFPRWICQNILGITDEGKIDDLVSIGGKNDYGIDIFHTDESQDITEQYVCWIQAKFSDKFDRSITREEIETFASTLGHLRDCPDSANNTFKQKAAEFVKIEERNPNIKKKMIFVVAGKLNDQAKELINNPRWINEKFGIISKSNIHFEVLNIDDILSRMVMPHTPTLNIKFDGKVIMRTDKSTKKKSIIGYVDATSLVNLAKDHKEILFLENPRQTLGKTAPTYKAIIDTLKDDNARKKFWKLNNGVTAICTSFNPTDNSEICTIVNFKIVNGRQTIFTLENTTSSLDGVYLLMTIHEAVNDKERNQISQATNTQNPIKPVDLITNYSEMTELVSQCKTNFKDFYFERQTKGFKTVDKMTKNRITSRRVMEKNSTARAYYAYDIDPNKAMMTDKLLFSITDDASPYYDVFKDRKIEQLIIPHIFMHMINGLHSKWCKELSDDSSDEILRNKGIISKEIVKYYLLKFIHESMMNIDESTRESIKDEMIEIFRKLKHNDSIPEIFLNVAQTAFNSFMLSFNTIKRDTWPKELINKINSKNYQPNKKDIPDPFDIMYELKQRGNKLLLQILQTRTDVINLHNADHVELSLRAISK